MLSFRNIIIYIFFIFLASCEKNEFTMEFQLPEDVTENYNVIYYATDVNGGLTIQAVAPVQKGKYTLKGVTKKPTLIYVTTRKSTIPLVVYAHKGSKIKITGESASPLSWLVEGDEINEALSQWRLENIEVLEKEDPAKINDAVAEFIESNPDSEVAPLIILTYFDRKLNEREFVDLMSRAGNISAKENWIKMASRADQPTRHLAFPATIETLVMRSAQGGSDTIRQTDSIPGFIAFWQNDMRDRKSLIDSLKSLIKEFPDSNKRVIADINLDPDSSMWRNSIRRDSLKKSLRLWAPAGMADQAVMKLKVGKIPYYLVIDRDGSQYYRGDEITEAMEKFRTLYNEKDSVRNKK